MLARWTNDEVVSTRHRVVSQGGDAARPRYAIALFCDADSPTPLAVLPQFCGPARPPRYETVTAGAYKAMRLAGQTMGFDA